jgi:hypothetical protein
LSLKIAFPEEKGTLKFKVFIREGVLSAEHNNKYANADSVILKAHFIGKVFSIVII